RGARPLRQADPRHGRAAQTRADGPATAADRPTLRIRDTGKPAPQFHCRARGDSRSVSRALPRAVETTRRVIDFMALPTGFEPVLQPCRSCHAKETRGFCCTEEIDFRDDQRETRSLDLRRLFRNPFPPNGRGAWSISRSVAKSRSAAS